MNILFLFSKYPEASEASGLHKDLPDEFCRQGHNVFVATIRERRLEKETSEYQENGRAVLRVKIGNMYDDVSRIEKALSVMSLDRALTSQIIKHWGAIKFDLIVGSSPWTAGDRLISQLKKHFRCPAFFILFDIFPQNAKDLGLIKNPLIFRFLKFRQLKSLRNFDYIGCMTKGNLNYISQNFPKINKDKLLIFPLWSNKSPVNKSLIKTKQDLGFKENDFIFVFGGNMGLPQNLPNVVRLANEVIEIAEIKFLFIGKGTESNKIKALAEELKLPNVTFLDHVDRSHYEALMLICDVGLVSLSHKFTVPNFPSKTMDYLKYNLPILASLDRCALADYGHFIEKEVNVGLCSYAEDMVSYKANLLRLYNDKHLYNQLVSNCQKTFEKEFNIKDNHDKICSII